MRLMIAERQCGSRHAEHNGAGPVDDQIRGGIRWWRPIGSTGLTCVGKREVNGGATLTVKFAGSVANESVEVCARRVGAPDTWVVKTIGRNENVVHVETMFVPSGSPIYFEAVV